LLYDSAIRLSELLFLKLTDVNLKNTTPYLRIHGKGDKERIVSISEGTVKHLMNYIKLFHNQDTPDTEYLFYTLIHNQANPMSPGNVERIINKYAEKIRPEHPELPAKVHPHMLRRTRATNLYQSDVELELVSRILGHASTQTTRIYAKPSLEMIKSAMDRSNPELNAEQPLWPDDEVELARIFGIR
jgi:integrase/recombinase XerD